MISKVEKAVEEGKINPWPLKLVLSLQTKFTCSHQLIKLYKMQGSDSTQIFMWDYIYYH